MKKFIIASIVGMLIMFIYSTLSWTILPVHAHTFHYTPKQDSIMKMLNSSLPGEGAYMMPIADNRGVGMMDSKHREEEEAIMKANVGKPMAVIFYSTGQAMNPMQIVLGVLYNLFTVVFAVVIFVMAKDKLKTFFMRWWFFIVIGFIVALNSYFLELNWMQYPWHYIKGFIVDVIMEWGLCGAWLAWYLRRA